MVVYRCRWLNNRYLGWVIGLTLLMRHCEGIEKEGVAMRVFCHHDGCRISLGLALVVVLVCVALLSVASFALPTRAFAATDSPNPNTWGTDGQVLAVAYSGTTVYIGGDFTRVGPATGRGCAGASSKWVTRNHIAAIDCFTGRATSWNPDADAPVVDLAVSGSSVYAAGGFSHIGGKARNCIAKLSVCGTGAADPTWDPNADLDVWTVAVSGSSVYAGGAFSSIGGQPRYGVAKLAASGTGAADPNWIANADGGVGAIAFSGSNVYVGGLFTNIGGQPRKYIARLNNTNGAVDPAWNPNSNSWVYKLEISGSSVFVGGIFSEIGGLPRNNIAKLSSTGTGGADPTWNPSADGAVWALAISGTSVYVGGEFTHIGGQARNQIAKLSSTGAGGADPRWNPNPNGIIVWDLAVSYAGVYVGGDFTSMGTVPSAYFAQLR
jgi:hypothetical protein